MVLKEEGKFTRNLNNNPRSYQALLTLELKYMHTVLCLGTSVFPCIIWRDGCPTLHKWVLNIGIPYPNDGEYNSFNHLLLNMQY